MYPQPFLCNFSHNVKVIISDDRKASYCNNYGLQNILFFPPFCQNRVFEPKVSPSSATEKKLSSRAGDR